MTKKRKLVTGVRVTLNNNNKDKGSYYLHLVITPPRGFEEPLDKCVSTYSRGDTNYQIAVMEAFRLLSSREYARMHIDGKFDQDLCKSLVLKHKLSCKGCLLECEMHQWEAAK